MDKTQTPQVNLEVHPQGLVVDRMAPKQPRALSLFQVQPRALSRVAVKLLVVVWRTPL